MTTVFSSLAVAVTPTIVVSDSSQARELVRSASSSAAFAAALATEAGAHGYDGFVLDFALDGFGSEDDAALAALAIKVGAAVGAGRSVGLTVPAARETPSLASGLDGTGVIVHITKTRSSSNLGQFDVRTGMRALQIPDPSSPPHDSTDGSHASHVGGGAFSPSQGVVAAAVAQFGRSPLSVGLSLSAADWWGGTERPSITDVTARFGAITAHSVHQVSLTLDWSASAYTEDQSRLDLVQLTLMAPFRGGVGMSWETIAPPADQLLSTRLKWGASLDTWRDAERSKLGYGGKGLPYDDPGLLWTREDRSTYPG